MFDRHSRILRRATTLLTALFLLLQILACGGTDGTEAPPPTSAPQAANTPAAAEPSPTPKPAEPTSEPTVAPTKPPAPPAETGIACFGTFGFGLTCLGEDGWQSFTEDNSSLGDDMIFDMVVCPDNRILIAHNSGISAFDGENWAEYQEAWGYSTVNAVACGVEGNIWVAYFGGVAHFDGTGWTTHAAEQLATGESATDLVEDVAVGPDGQVWVATAYSVATLDGDEWTVFQEGDGFDETVFLDAITVDDQGRPWAAHTGGLLMYDGMDWTEYNNPDLVTVEDLVTDAGGNVWAGTFSDGVSVFSGQTWTTYHTGNSGLSSNHVRAVAFDAQGRAWLGTEWGLSVFDGADWTSYHMHTSDLADNDIYALAVIEGGASLPQPVERTPGSVTGRIEREGGGVVSGATVELCVESIGMFFYGPTPCSEQPFSLQATTDADGVFTFDELPIGRYVLVVQDPVDEKWAELTGDFGLTEYVLVEEGEETDLGDLFLSESEE